MDTVWTREKAVSYMLEDMGSAISYWGTREVARTSKNVAVDVFVRTLDGVEFWAFTPADFANAVGNWVAGYEGGRAYFERFCEAWRAGEWGAVDYDADVLDVIVQHAMFGHLRFA